MTTTHERPDSMMISRFTRFELTAIRRASTCLLVALAILAIPAGRVLAAPNYTGAGFTGDWDDVGNWEFFAAPANNGTEYVDITGGLGGGGHNPVIDHSWNIRELEFRPNSNRQWTVGGSGTLTVGSGGIDNHSGVFQKVAVNVSMSTTQAWDIDANLHAAGVISGGGKLQKDGNAELLLDKANTYTGGTSILAGTIRTSANHVIPAGQMVIHTGGILDLDGHMETIGPGSVSTTGLIMYGNAAIYDANNFAISTLGTFIDYRTGSGYGYITGNMRLGTSSIPRTISVQDDSSAYDLEIIANISNQASNQNDPTADINKTGAGTLYLSGNNTFWRHVDVSEGKLTINGDTALGNTAGDANTGTNVVSGATLELYNASVTNEHLTLAGNGAGGAGALSNSLGDNLWSGPVVLAADSIIGVRNSGHDLTLSGVISGGGILTKTGPGTLILTGDNNFTGDTAITSGKLIVDNIAGSATGTGDVVTGHFVTLGGNGNVSGDVTVKSGSTVAPGNSVGILSVGGVTFDAGSLFDVEFTGTGSVPGVDFDQLIVGGGTGHADLDGTFNAMLGGSFDPSPGETYEVMTFGSRTGEFAQHNGLGLVGDSFLLPQYSDTSLTIFAAIPGDADLSGIVDIGDFTIWGDHFGSTGSTFADGDFTGDGQVDVGDFTIWGDHFGELVSSPGGGLTAVPEPSTWVLLLIGAVGLFFVRRRPAK